MTLFALNSEIEKAQSAGFRFTPANAPAYFLCGDCLQEKAINMQGNGATGYAGLRDSDALVCYQCAGLRDAREMRETGKGLLYLVKRGDEWRVTNWPGTLELVPSRVKRGSHNIARERFDVWFSFEGEQWHGTNIGDNQVLRARRLKARGRKPVYFCVMQGLRGCYMPDDASHHVAVTFAEFAAIVRDYQGDDMKSLGQARFAWSHIKRGKWQEVCLFADRENSGYGVTVSGSCESDYNSQQEENS